MSSSTNLRQCETLLQEGVSCALATVHAIEAAELFRDLPADKSSHDQHNHGLWLIAMLGDQLRRIQQQVDALSIPQPAATAQGEG